MTDTDPRRERTPGALSLGALIAGALALRVWCLTCQSLWENEGYTVALAQRSFGHMLSLFKIEGNGTLYPLLYWPLERIGTQLWLVRAPALLAGVLAVPALYWAGRKLVGTRAAFAGAALLAVNPLAVYFSQEARGYVFVALFSSLSFGCLVNAVEHRGRRWWPLYVLATAAAVYSHTLAALIVPAQAVVVWPRGREAVKAWLLSGVATAVVLGPQVYLLLADAGRRDPLYFLARPGPKDLVQLVRAFGTGRTASNAVLVPVAVIAAALLVAAAVRLRRRASPAGSGWSGPIAAAAWAITPIALALLVSAAHPVIAGGIPQYVLSALPGFCLLVGWAIATVPLRAGVAALITLAAIGIGCVAWQNDHVVKENWRAAVPWILAHRGANDPILIDNVIKLPALGYYGAALRAPDGRLVVEEWHDTPLPHAVSGLVDPSGYGDAREGPPTAALLAGLARRTGRMSLVLADPIGQGDIEQGAALRWARRACRVGRHSFPARTPDEDVVVLTIAGCRGTPG